MEIVSFVFRYGLFVAIIVEVILVGRALIRLAMEKARPSSTKPAEE